MRRATWPVKPATRLHSRKMIAWESPASLGWGVPRPVRDKAFVHTNVGLDHILATLAVIGVIAGQRPSTVEHHGELVPG